MIDRQRLWEHFNFGYKLTLAGILNTIFVNAYNIVIGKFFSATQVGFYSKADRLRMFPVKTLSSALKKVTYPLFSEMQNDNDKLRMVYRKVMMQSMFIITPVLSYAFISAEPLFRFFLTEKWLPAVPYFRILCFVGLLHIIQSYNLNILNVKGRSDLFLKLEIIKKFIIVIGIAVTIPFGILGLLYFQVVNSLISYGINSYYSGLFINYPALSQIRDILPVILMGIIPALFVYFIIYHLLSGDGWSDIFQLLITCVVYFTGYFGLNDLIKTNTYLDLKSILLTRQIHKD